MQIKIKRVYDAPSEEDGKKILGRIKIQPGRFGKIKSFYG